MTNYIIWEKFVSIHFFCLMVKSKSMKLFAQNKRSADVMVLFLMLSLVFRSKSFEHAHVERNDQETGNHFFF